MRTEKCDFLIVGTGAAGLAAAAASQGLDTLLIEQASILGGSSSYSGGCIWIPGNCVSRDQGIRDTVERGRLHLDALLGPPRDDRPESSAARRDALLHTGPEMISFFREMGFKWSSKKSTFPDFHPDLPGTCAPHGRTIDPAVVNLSPKLLGPWIDYVQYSSNSPPVARFEDFRPLTRPLSSWGALLTVLWVVLKWTLMKMVRSPVCMGNSLVAQLLSICWKNGNVRIYRQTELISLITKDGVVVGGILQQGETQIKVQASAVLLATSGFARSQEMRDSLLPRPTSVSWSVSSPCGDTGTALRVGKPLGAATASLDKVWGISTMHDPITRCIVPCCFEMARPHSIVVNQDGNRFVCESGPFIDIVDTMLQGGRATSPAWLIVDWNYRKRYTLGSLQPRASSPHLITADSIAALAQKIGLPAADLESTVSRWNLMCHEGQDRDFGRGRDAYQRYIGDPNMKANPNMGPLSAPPFTAIEIYPGDAGTRGGLLTDEQARVVKTDGSVIQGLYAAGNASATVMTAGSPGAGGTLGPAMTFAYIAANHVREAQG